jgi:stage II sporulation protein R
MFRKEGLNFMKVIRIILGMGIIGAFLIGAFWGPIYQEGAVKSNNINKSLNESNLAPQADQLIRFHVLANSDSDHDQELKRAVRDAILAEVSPQLAVSQSLNESRQILQKVRPNMESIGRSIVKKWGKDYSVRTEFGHSLFPTKSYGSLVLPAGNYEALRVVIGEGQGSNWWCVLFPPLCFIDINQSTAVQVDGKPAIPIKKEEDSKTVDSRSSSIASSELSVPKVRFFFWEMIIKLFR